MALGTVADYLAEARTLMQDEDAIVKRYSDAELTAALGFCILEMRRIRPEFFNSVSGGQNNVVPDINRSTSPTTVISLPVEYRYPLVYGIIGHALQRDEEETSQTLAQSYLQRFLTKVLYQAA